MKHRKRLLGVFTLGILLLASTAAMCRPDWHYLEVDQRTRRYLVHEPTGSKGPHPVLLAFHGGGGTASIMSREGFSRFTEEGYLVVYPDGIDRHWNDTRSEHPLYDSDVDDVKFTEQLLDELARNYDVDPSRVYATGISNGAIMTHVLGMKLGHRLAAIAPIVGGVPRGTDLAPAAPLSVLIIQGTLDPAVPYQGGPITVGKGGPRGEVLSTEAAVELWRRHNGCDKSETWELPDTADDGCKVTGQTWSGGRQGTEVVLYRIEGGGHTVPGGKQYLPRRLIGVVCRDINAVDVLMSFFRDKRLPGD